MLFKISKCPACKKIFTYFRIVKKSKAQPLQTETLFKTIECKRCEQNIGIFKNNKTKQSSVKWIEHESLEEEFVVYYNKLNLLKDKLLKRISYRNKKKWTKGNKQYFSTRYEMALNKKISSIKTLINLRTIEEQRNLRANVALFVRNKTLLTGFKKRPEIKVAK